MRDPFDLDDVDGLTAEEIDKLIDEQMDQQLTELMGIDVDTDVDSSFGWDPFDIPTKPVAYTNSTKPAKVVETPKSGIEQLAEQLKRSKETT